MFQPATDLLAVDFPLSTEVTLDMGYMICLGVHKVLKRDYYTANNNRRYEVIKHIFVASLIMFTILVILI